MTQDEKAQSISSSRKSNKLVLLYNSENQSLVAKACISKRHTKIAILLVCSQAYGNWAQAKNKCHFILYLSLLSRFLKIG
jgi:hypothetical protein